MSAAWMLCELSCANTPFGPYTELPVRHCASFMCLCGLLGLRRQEIEVYRSNINRRVGFGWIGLNAKPNQSTKHYLEKRY